MSNYVSIIMTRNQWCSGKFSLVGTLAWYYGYIPIVIGGGGCLNELSRVKKSMFKHGG